MTVYPEMNNKIVDLLRMGGTPVELYAAQRIEELELKNMELIGRVLEIIDDEIKQRNRQFRVNHDLAAGKMLKERILELKGGEQE